jgi:membrane-associated protease RseP (regulator of RpoE activity)
MIPNISGFGFFQENLFNIIFYAASINFGLFIFNLIPIPPLDGSHIIFSCLNLHPDAENRIRRFGMPLLIVILIIQNYADVSIIPIGKMIGAIINFFL